MTEFSKDYRKLYREALESNNLHSMKEILEQVLTEAGCPDPGQQGKSAEFGARCAAAKNNEGKGPEAKKLQ